MARGRIDTNHRPNTLKENKMVLFELRSRGKIEHKTSQELSKLFAKLNSDNAPKNWKNCKAARVDKIPAEHPYGPIKGFPPGSWWGIRMDCSRDRVHEPFNADIQEGPAGVVSLCTSHLNIHNDEDLGDSLTFTGDNYSPEVQTSDPLLRSYQTQVPFRLVRSYNLTNDYAPKTGYRYDGLYTVANYWIGVNSKTEKYYKYALTRVRNQEPPVWQNSSISKSQNLNNVKLSKTRLKNDRLSSKISTDYHENTNEQQNNPHFSRYKNDYVKFSLAKLTNDNVTDKMTNEINRNTHESDILTRCTSVKKIELPTSSNMISVPYSESPIQNTPKIIENTGKNTICKLQNTNISIRTDLYDSSHNIQYDMKKSIPMTFCRTFGSSRNTRIINHSHVGTLNLNSCGPCPRDGEQESLIQSRSGMNKNISNQSPFSDSNRSGERSTPKIYSITSPHEAKINQDNLGKSRIPEVTSEEIGTDGAVINRSNDEKSDNQQRNKENSPSKIATDSDDKTIDDHPNICPITRTRVKKNLITSDKNKDEIREDTLKEHSTAFDSLTPDQMLKYIVKRKYHPTAKLLIGSVIGLATGESKILRTYDSLITRNKSWSRNKKLLEEKKETPMREKRRVGNRGRETSEKSESKKEKRKVEKSATRKRPTKERMLSMRLRRTRVSKRLLGSEKKTRNVKICGNSSKSLTSEKAKKSQKPFSKLTSSSNSNKCVKKVRRSELANLAIDAKIGPLVRGPRNRRLRGRSHIFAKKRYEIEISNCCNGKHSKVGVAGKKKDISSLEISGKRPTKRLNSTAKREISKRNFLETHKKRLEKTETRRNVERKIQSSSVGRSSRKNVSISPKKGEKRRRSSGNENRSHESISHETNDLTSKKICQRAEKDVSTIEKMIKMVDAATQCSNKRDVATFVDDNIQRTSTNEENENSVKVEWIDLDDVKSEYCDSDEEQFVFELASERYSNDEGSQKNPEQPEISEKGSEILSLNSQNDKLSTANVSRRLSAFVPVNISDSDFRIARLRSIGFRPIEAQSMDHQMDLNAGDESAKEAKESTVLNRVADEEYNKYTSEETTVVGYMDQQLRYEDIEEDVVKVIGDEKNSRKIVDKTADKASIVRNSKTKKCESVERTKNLRISESLDDDFEIPWHGWKKFVKNKQAHWVGW